MKSEVTLEEPSLLKRISSSMQVDPYNRVASLAKAVQLLEAMIKSIKQGDVISEHNLLQTGLSQDQFKLTLKEVFDLCIVRNLEV